MPPLTHELGMIGSDVDNFGCPRCGSHDRERHLFMYMKSSNFLSQIPGKTVLHFAPERRLSHEIALANPAQYIRCDLHPALADIEKVDMLAMEFESSSFDIVIANHVLEHVADDIQALSEIRRVLKIGGHAVLQTPYAEKLHKTWEDTGISDDNARLHAYGQADHVRLYGRDIFNRFSSTGLKSCVAQHTDLLADVDPAKSGINPKEPFFLFQRL